MDLITHDARQQERFEHVMNKLNEGKTMSTDATNGQSVWGPAAGAFFGAAFGENGLFNGGNKGGAGVTTEQLTVGLNQLQGQLQRDGIEHSISGISKDIGLAAGGLAIGITGVKDAVVASSSANALAMCTLGNSMTQGFSAVNQSILLQGAASRELALQQALDVERARATEYRIELSENRNAAAHTSTQVLLNQVINAK